MAITPTGALDEDERLVSSEDGCLFCAIIAGKIPATIVREDADTVAFLDIDPKAPIHVLVVPRDHAPNIAESYLRSAETVDALIAAALAVAADQGVTEGWRLVFNTGDRAGQTVFHTHAHVMGYPESTA